MTHQATLPLPSPRPLRTSPAYPAHVEAGADFAEKSGWGRVNFFRTNESRGDASRRPEGPSGEGWSPAIEAEHRATREAAGLFDLSSFGKIDVQGPGAAALLEYACDNRVSRGIGAVTYTQMLNEAGGVVADLTVTHVGTDRFFVVTGTGGLTHDLAWLSRLAPSFEPVSVSDVTSGSSCFGLWGPQAREILSPLSPLPLDSQAFPYMTSRQTTIGDIPVRMTRLTFVGELGWEIYAPTEFGRSLWSQLSTAVESAGALRCGYRAIDSLRIEKGYLYLGADITAETTPYEAGLGFCVRPDKEFVGRDALLAAGNPRRKLVCLRLATNRRPVAGGEPVVVDGTAVSAVTSGALGLTIDQSLAFCYLPLAAAAVGTPTQVFVDGSPVDAIVVEQPVYDPLGARLRA